MRADDVFDRLHELARELFELALGQARGVDRDAALGPAKREVHDRRLPGHERGEGADVVEVDLPETGGGTSARNKGVGRGSLLWARARPHSTSDPAPRPPPHLRVVAQPPLERPARVVVLHAVCVERLDLAVIPRDDQLDEDFPLRREEQALQLVGVLELDEGLGGGGGR